MGSLFQIRNKSNDFQTARANVRVHGGKWYFEVTPATTGTIYFGWCAKEFQGSPEACLWPRTPVVAAHSLCVF